MFKMDDDYVDGILELMIVLRAVNKFIKTENFCYINFLVVRQSLRQICLTRLVVPKSSESKNK